MEEKPFMNSSTDQTKREKKWKYSYGFSVTVNLSSFANYRCKNVTNKSTILTCRRRPHLKSMDAPMYLPNIGICRYSPCWRPSAFRRRKMTSTGGISLPSWDNKDCFLHLCDTVMTDWKTWKRLLYLNWRCLCFHATKRRTNKKINKLKENIGIDY